VEGGSLRDRQTRLRAEHPDPTRAIVELYLAAGRGLAAAHEAGIVHRDFKPDNVLVDARGEVRVADFGLACAAERRSRIGNGTQPSRIPNVRDSSGLGTPGYISGEQYLGRVVDARADQFAFCVAL
jgi:eukaryotic-like serine/threonine-protein kinase